MENTAKEDSKVTALAPVKSFSLTPSNLEEAMSYAQIIAKSEMVPKDYQGKPGNVLVAVQMGAEVGLPAMQALQNIAVINGRPSIWGDAVLGLIKAHPRYEWINETFDEPNMTAICTIKRKGEPEQTRSFSQKDANTAKLWAKTGPWTTNPKRMLQMRARAFACRDVFPDALKGLGVAEEVSDYVPSGAPEVTVENDLMPRSTTETAKQPAAQQAAPQEAPVQDAEFSETPAEQAAAPEGNGETLTAGQVKLLTAKAAGKIELADVAANFGVDDIADIPRDKINDAINFVTRAG